jgi:hypothetical protein
MQIMVEYILCYSTAFGMGFFTGACLVMFVYKKV